MKPLDFWRIIAAHNDRVGLLILAGPGQPWSQVNGGKVERGGGSEIARIENRDTVTYVTVEAVVRIQVDKPHD